MEKKPLYQIIENDLRHAILNGELKQGDLIPSEMELVAKYKVSRFTVRQAINNLLVDGYIYRHKGRGTIVTFNKKEMDQDGRPFFSFTKEMKNIDTPIESSVLNFQKIKADELLASRLQVKAGDDLYYIERFRHSNGIPLVFERIYLPVNLYNDLDQNIFTGSFYDYVQDQLHWKIRNCVRSIEARALSKPVATLFGQKEGEPTLYMSSITYLDNGRAFVYTRCYFHGEHFRFKQNSLTRTNDKEF
jgi:GntR family transcriptional regulator